MINGTLVLLLVEVTMLLWYNWYFFKRMIKLNKNLKKLLMYCCEQRIKDYNWPMDKNIVKKAEMIYEKETKFLNRHFLAKEILDILDESKLVVFTLRGF